METKKELDYRERLETIYLMARNGHTLKDIGESFGLTRERIRQILNYFRREGAKFARVQAFARKAIIREILVKYKDIEPTEAEKREKEKLECLIQIYKLAKQGYNYRTIAEKLGVHYQIVVNYCSMFKKLGAQLPSDKKIKELVRKVIVREQNTLIKIHKAREENLA